jgi:hypothetical protein
MCGVQIINDLINLNNRNNILWVFMGVFILLSAFLCSRSASWRVTNILQRPAAEGRRP